MSVWDYAATRATDSQKLAALKSAIDRLTADFGSWQVPWGEIKSFPAPTTARSSRRSTDAKPSIGVPFTASQWGSLAAFGAKRYPGTKRYYGTLGNSFVAAVEFGPKVKAVAISAGGESGDPASRHFNDQAEGYAKGALRPVYFYPEDLKGHVEAELSSGGVGCSRVAQARALAAGDSRANVATRV